jgi:hypothetical protein
MFSSQSVREIRKMGKADEITALIGVHQITKLLHAMRPALWSNFSPHAEVQCPRNESDVLHNLSRELQMQIEEPVRGTTEKGTVRWLFEELYALVEPSLPGPDA